MTRGNRHAQTCSAVTGDLAVSAIAVADAAYAAVEFAPPPEAPCSRGAWCGTADCWVVTVAGEGKFPYVCTPIRVGRGNCAWGEKEDH